MVVLVCQVLGFRIRCISPIMGEQSVPSPKRPRSGYHWPVDGVRHSDWICAAASLTPMPNYLQQLYPHIRDDACTLDELHHVYSVNGAAYKYSASDVVNAFFLQFDKELAHRVLEKPLRNLQCSVYWLYMYLVLIEGLGDQEDAFALRVNVVLEAAGRTFSTAVGDCGWNYSEAVDIMSNMRKDKVVSKPPGRACYFLARCAGCTGLEVQHMWHQLGQLEALKGTVLHKQIELYMQELGRWQLETGQRRVCLCHVPLAVSLQARQAAIAPVALLHVVSHTSSLLWDQWLSRVCLLSLIQEQHSSEFLKFESWLSSKPSFSPYRSEWSLYHDGFGVAGQLDALWFDLSACSETICMVDWKRSRRLLSIDIEVQREQSYNQVALQVCELAPCHANPCASWYNCGYNRYAVQQNLYAFFLHQKYDILIEQSLLLQCHPDIESSTATYNEVEVKIDRDMTLQLLESFAAGWHSHADAQKKTE